MFFDWTYLVFILPALIIAMMAQANVTSTFAKYKKVLTSRGVTGFEAARRILDSHGLSYVSVSRVDGKLTDHFDPKTNVIRLSADVYDGTSVASVGVAAHEAGHAVQYAEQYAPMKLRSAIIPATNIGSNLAFPLVLLGVVFSYPPIAYIGAALFGVAVLFQLVTLPVEMNASSRALKCLDESAMFTADELSGSKKVLTAAALTYVAALFTALASLLRLLVIANRSNRR
ncbi:MAG: zinc metallopeptidase [Eubacteriales bacterium]